MPALAELVAAEAAAVEDFIACLAAEEDSLKAGDAEALATSAARKAGLAERLNELEDERNGFLRRAGLMPDRQGMFDWLARNPQDRAAVQAWERLLALAAEARRRNQLNGQLIAMRLQATNQALAALSRQAPRSNLYGPDGQATLLTGSRIIDAV